MPSDSAERSAYLPREYRDLGCNLWVGRVSVPGVSVPSTFTWRIIRSEDIFLREKASAKDRFVFTYRCSQDSESWQMGQIWRNSGAWICLSLQAGRTWASPRQISFLVKPQARQSRANHGFQRKFAGDTISEPTQIRMSSDLVIREVAHKTSWFRPSVH
jgi:hypothetical protein